MEVLNFQGDLFSRKYLPHENKLLTKLNRFTVNENVCTSVVITAVRNTTSIDI